MLKLKNKKAAALIIVLFSLLVGAIFANIIIAIMSSQARLTHHQISRIQAYYAAMAGMNYGLEMLRRGDWDVNRRVEFDLADNTFPPSILNRSIRVISIPVGAPGCESVPSGVKACVITKATYTYTP